MPDHDDVHQRIETLVRSRAREAMRRAAKAGVPFDQSFVDDSVLALKQSGFRCQITGRAFDIDYRTPGAGGTHYAPSPDRMIPGLGYVRGNVRWILWCLNRGKGEMSAEHHLEVCRMVARYVAGQPTSGASPIPPITSLTADIPSKTGQPPYRGQQIAAFKAHATMVRNALGSLTGAAREAAEVKLVRYEAIVKASLSSEG